MPATGTAPTAETAYSVTITITTNSAPGNLAVSGINGQCLAQDGTTVLRRFSGMGNGASAKEVFGDVMTNCPVTFVWAEQQPANANVTCTGFTLNVSNPSVSTELSPFPAASFAPANLSISPGGTLLSTTVVNGNASWDYAGSITTVRGTDAARTATYDPELDVHDLDT